MQIDFNVEYELTKEVIYDEENEPMQEYIFIVPAEWLSQMYKEHLTKMFDYEGWDLDVFLATYDPEIEGTAIYHLAKADNVIIDEGWAEIAEY